MRKFLIRITVLLSMIIVAIWTAAWYVKPAQELDLKYEEISIERKIAEIVKQRKLEVRLTEQDLNNLIKKYLSQHSELPHGFVIKGADFQLQGERLEADVNLLWDYKVHMGAKLFFQLNWKQPVIEVIHTGTEVKHIRISPEKFQLPLITIPIEDSLPPLIGIQGIAFEQEAIRVGLKMSLTK